MDFCTNSVAGSGAGCAHAEYADDSFAVHPLISENVSWRSLVVVLDQELHPKQIVYVLFDARGVLESSGKPFVGLAGSDFTCGHFIGVSLYIFNLCCCSCSRVVCICAVATDHDLECDHVE